MTKEALMKSIFNMEEEVSKVARCDENGGALYLKVLLYCEVQLKMFSIKVFVGYCWQPNVATINKEKAIAAKTTLVRQQISASETTKHLVTNATKYCKSKQVLRIDPGNGRSTMDHTH